MNSPSDGQVEAFPDFVVTRPAKTPAPPTLLDELRHFAYEWFAEHQQPVSLRQIRARLAELQYTGSRYFLGSVFRTRMWLQVGWDLTGGTNERPVRSYVPRVP